MGVLSLFFMFQIKHFVCDFLLQNQYMLGKFKDWPHFIKPLAAHSMVNALGTLLIGCILAPRLALSWFSVDLISHFIIDRIKARRTAKLGLTAKDALFWFLIGADQMAHQLIYILLAKSFLVG
jgi:hypothetical protein